MFPMIKLSLSSTKCVSKANKWATPSLTDDKAVTVKGEVYQVVLEDK